MPIAESRRLYHFDLMKKTIIKRAVYKALSKRLFNNYLKSNTTKKLQIGCGSNLLNGWLNTDLAYKRKLVGYLDASKKFPFHDQSFDYIFSEHNIEHLDIKEAFTMLSECYRILKPGGHLRIATPNFNFLIQLYDEPHKQIHKDYINWAAKEYIKDVIDIIDETEILNVFVINNFFKDWGHQIIHNLASLNKILVLCGFTNISQLDTGYSKIPDLMNLESHGKSIPNEYNLLETMVIEAQK